MTAAETGAAPLVVVHPDPAVLSEAAAARLLTRLLDAQSVRTPVHAVLTGGTVGIKTLAAVAASPLRAAVDWSGVHLWWGDERFLPDGDPDRNETQARAALVDALVADAGLPADHVHGMPAPGAVVDGTTVQTPEQAAAAYAADLARFAPASVEEGVPAVPEFDVLLLGMGPDGHVASLFPGHAGLAARGATIGVHGSPKPPPERVSLTFDALHRAREVWVVAAGAEKAAQAAAALAGGPVTEVPAAGARGTERTLWLLDAAAAALAA
ncbi:6-phosphogluconolactonase [Krasilnikoviella flava]|uniref:6-phosphogluconolactonase n=1 Tax=Krasilnikoviella flava TaxID=526729 RepID=A0A1T5L464_9MICO|nr:6-phosphogluconolactonase [Krasilnikoviella flava]SKC70734.1 6-phosphogluconolactonase [Krasilnikoviella flava]